MPVKQEIFTTAVRLPLDNFQGVITMRSNQIYGLICFCYTLASCILVHVMMILQVERFLGPR